MKFYIIGCVGGRGRSKSLVIGADVINALSFNGKAN